MLEHRFTWITIVATFLLLIVGGTVNPTGSSLACPEPTLICRGELFPQMTGGVLYEHGHRLVAMTVGMLQIALTFLLWRRRPSLRWLGVGALVLVSAQGALGAITVQFKLPWAVSTSHLLMAMGYLALLLYIARRTRVGGDEPGIARPVGSARRWIAVAAVAVLAQILLGGLMRHHGGALASVELPLVDGSLWPSGAPLALQLHMAHRIGGIVVALIVLAAAHVVYRQSRGWGRMRVLAVASVIVVVLQVTLGVLTIASLRSVPIAVSHFAGAATLWALWCSMWLMTSGVRAAPTRRSHNIDSEPALAGGPLG